MDNHHLYICGKSGTGKSTYIKNLLLEEIEARDHPIFFVDPLGPNAIDLLDAIPKALTEKVTYIDCSDTEYAVGFNPNTSPVHTLSSLKSIWHDSWGPRMNHILRNALMLLHENPGTTFADIPSLFFDKDKRKRLLVNVKRTSTRDFWKTGGEFEKKYEKARDNPDSPILNKIGEILSTDIARNLCQKHPRFDFRKALDNNQIVIVNLALPTIGDEAAAIMGSLFITSLRGAILERDAELRAMLPNPSDFVPLPVRLFVDEFELCGTPLIAGMLSTMRNFGLMMGLSHQYLTQISEPLLDGILGNVGNKVIFMVDYADAVVLARSYNRLNQDCNPAAFTEAQLSNHQAFINGALEYHLPRFEPITRGRLNIVKLRSRENFGRRL